MITLQDKKIQELEKKVSSLLQLQSKFDQNDENFDHIASSLENINRILDATQESLENNLQIFLTFKGESKLASSKNTSAFDEFKKDFQNITVKKLFDLECFTQSTTAHQKAFEERFCKLEMKISTLENALNAASNVRDSLIAMIQKKDEDLKALENRINTLKSESEIGLKSTLENLNNQIEIIGAALQIRFQENYDALTKKINASEKNSQKMVADTFANVMTSLQAPLNQLRNEISVSLTKMFSVSSINQQPVDNSDKIKVMENSIASIFNLLKKYESRS